MNNWKYNVITYADSYEGIIRKCVTDHLMADLLPFKGQKFNRELRDYIDSAVITASEIFIQRHWLSGPLLYRWVLTPPKNHLIIDFTPRAWKIGFGIIPGKLATMGITFT